MKLRMIRLTLLASSLALSSTVLAGGNPSDNQADQPSAGSGNERDRNGQAAGAAAGSSQGGGAKGGAKGSQGQQGAPGGQGNTDAPVIVLVPTTTAQDPNLANGCWARLYDGTNYTGNMLTLSGPVDIPSGASSVANFEFGREYDSVMVGRNATLMVYDDENYQQRTATFRAGQQVPDLDERMGYFEEIKSLRLRCGQGGQVPSRPQ